MKKILTLLFLTIIINSSLNAYGHFNHKQKSLSHYYLIPKYIKYNVSNNSPEAKDNEYGVDFGYYIGKNLSVIIPYSKSKNKIEGIETVETEKSRYGVYTVYHKPYSENIMFDIKLGYIVEKSDNIESKSFAYGVGVEVYTSRTMAFVVEYDKNDLEDTFSNSSISCGLKILF